ncbi:hypothetical protein M378DRAFT_157440 [Amanita muscaria Koide BX008]|uniref:Uncharacterized protein n=1 Tax=Amanita muscaria (strain Koide BX008) TaxID=946122 RepID=A0A0C2XJG2_AMAMK|nr:hypothetical protein M378DRAFT_157440 [Amanita muscaria Koide BX008]
MEVLKEKIKACPRGSTLDGIYADAITRLEHWSYGSSKATGSQAANIMKCCKRMGDIIEGAVSKVKLSITARSDSRNSC